MKEKKTLKIEGMSCAACSSAVERALNKADGILEANVNIATEMLLDAVNNRFDIALLISADSDLVPPIKAIRTHYPEKRVTVAFPPRRYSTDLERAASSSFHIGRAKIAQSRFPERVTKTDGFVLERPSEWS